MKQCKKCNEFKDLSEFNKSLNNKDKLSHECKSCLKIYKHEYYLKNKEIHNKKAKLYYLKNKEKITNVNKIYRLKHIDKWNTYIKEYHSKNKEAVTKIKNKWSINNDDKIRLYRRKPEVKKARNKRFRDRRKNDPIFLIACRLRGRIRNAFAYHGFDKKGKSESIIGISFKDFKIYLEKKFTKGMNWENKGKWHIDHIIPLSSAKTEEDLIRLCHYTNLQPLWSKDNISKKDKIIQTQLKLTI